MGKIIALVIIVGLGVMMYLRSQANNEAASKNVQLGNAFLKENQTKPDVQVTTSGLQYQLLTKGDGDTHPKATDTVNVHYHGTLLDGTVFDSSVDRGEPISFGLKQVIKGWTEGLQLMAVGDKMRFYIPAHLAYGNRAAGKIAPGSTLIFDVELLAIK